MTDRDDGGVEHDGDTCAGDSERFEPGGYTRVCGDCGHTWFVQGFNGDEPCPECGHVNEEGEDTFDWGTCLGCGTSVSASNPPVEGFPGQRYCSAECGGLV